MGSDTGLREVGHVPVLHVSDGVGGQAQMFLLWSPSLWNEGDNGNYITEWIK